MSRLFDAFFRLNHDGILDFYRVLYQAKEKKQEKKKNNDSSNDPLPYLS